MILYLSAIAIVALNIAATRHVLRDGRRLGYEKSAEIGLIWILPVMGALVSVCISLQGPSKVREYEDINRFFRTPNEWFARQMDSPPSTGHITGRSSPLPSVA